jgi:4-hydroxy-2-oxoglutarate aldolase
MAKTLSGIFPALVTPFQKGKLSLSGLKSNIKKLNRFDFTGYVVLGSTGEGILMDEQEGLRAIETVRAAAVPGKIVIAGTGSESSSGTVDFSNKAARAGADYSLVVTPFYYKAQMTAAALEAYYRKVADKSKIPIILYTVPKFTGLELPLQTIVAMAAHPNVVGLKDSSGNMAAISETLKACPSTFSLFQGHGSLLLSALLLGAKGGILALSNMAHGETVEIFKLFQAGDYEKARELQSRLLPVNQKVVGGFGVPGIKCAAEMLGYAAGEPRPPLRPVSAEVKESIRKILKEGGLLQD